MPAVVPAAGFAPRLMAVGAAVIVLAVAAIVAAVVMLALHVSSSIDELQSFAMQSEAVGRTAEHLQTALLRADTDERGYLLTTQDSFLTPYRAAVTDTRTCLDDLTKLAVGHPWLAADASALRTVVTQKLALMDSGIATARTHALTPAQLQTQDVLGRGNMAEVRRLIDDITTRSETEITRRSQQLHASAMNGALGVLGAAFFTAAMLGASAVGLLISRGRLVRVQQSARIQSERLQSAVNHTRDGVAVFDARDRLLLWNRAFFPATGFPDEMARIGTPFARFAESAVEWQPPFLSGGRPPVQARVTEARRGRRMLEVWRSAMPDGGQMVAVADITRRVEAEAIAGQAQKMEALGQLTGGVAHDFNNLLQVVSANLELIGTRVGADDWLRARLTAAMAGVERGARLTRHLLAFARRQSLAPQAVDTMRLLGGMEEMLRRTLGDEIEIELVVSGNLWAIRADPQQLENAVLNLAINARDAMPQGGRLTIEGRNASLDESYAATNTDVTPGQYVMIAVSDTGIGMTAEQMSRAIEPFYTTKPEGRGTGLGLSMVYGFARQSGGHLKLYSEPGQGTTVRIYIPRTTSLPKPPPRPAEEAHPAAGETILLVEDDAAVRLAAAHALRGLGYRVSEADSADAAIAMLNRGERPDLLFTDVVMPGIATARQLAEHARLLHPSVAVLFTSGYTEPATAHRGLLDPGARVIAKPWRLEELARRLRDALTESRQPHPEVPTRLRILLTEDDPLVRLTTADLLADMGHEVRQAANGAQTLELLDGVDLLITDLGLPDMDGRALAHLCWARRSELRVILASGQDHLPEDDDMPMVWLEKPFSEAALRAALVRSQSLPSGAGVGGAGNGG